MKHETNIDTVAFQIDFEKAEDQRNKLNLLCQWLTIRELGKLELDESSKIIIKYEVFYAGAIIFTIHSGFTSKADGLTGEKGLYYIRIRFAGLKSHKQRQDEASFNALMTICAFLNTTSTRFRMVELDVAIDVLFCSFDNILAICINKSGKTTYNEIGHKQFYKGVPTSYIEKYTNKIEANNAVVRSYLYNKSVKEGLSNLSITRFELKLQNRFFLQYDFNTQSIINAMNKYYVMYFEYVKMKNQYIDLLNNFKITPKNIEILGLSKYRLHVNENVIKEFIRQVESVYVGFYGDIVVPIAKNRND